MAHAETALQHEQPASISRAALLGLAKQFVNKVDGGFKAADQDVLPKPGSPAAEQEKIRRAFDSIPDGEILLLNLTLYNGITINGQQRDTIYIKDPILTIKEGQDVMISLTEFVATANFPIGVDAQARKASGWYIRETQMFSLDMDAGVIQAGDKHYDIKEGDVVYENDDIYVKGAFLGQLFDFGLQVNPARQEARIQSAQKWPVEEKIDRDKRFNMAKNQLPPPRLPRLENDDLRDLGPPVVDIISTDRYAYQKGSEPERAYANRYSARAAGDVLGHTAEVYANGSDEQRLESLRVTMSKNSEEPDLLGPLKARSYSFADVMTTQVPFAGAAPYEMGFQATNKDPFSTYNTMTTITGDSIPGWDVELFRDQEYLTSARVGDDGRYEFTDVILFNGLNRLRVVQYGGRGEIREEDRSLFVGPRTFNNQNGAYDFSISAQETQTYRAEDSQDNDRWQPHLAATYDYQLSNELALRSGIQARQEDGKERVYLQGGAVQSFGRTVLNQDVVMNNEGAYTGVLTARHNIQRHNIYASAKYESDNYNPGADSNEPSLFELEGSVRGPLPDLIGNRNQYSFNSNYQSYGDGNEERGLGLSYSTQLGRIVAQNTINDRWRKGAEGGESVITNDVFSLRGAALGLNWRTAVDYNIRPDSRINSYNVELQKRFNDNLSARMEVEHRPYDKYTIGELSASYTTPYAVFGPAISYDTSHRVEVSLRTSTALAYNPYDKDVKFSNRSLTSKGSLSAFVYLDKNGNLKFDDGDTPIEGALVQAIHARRGEETNEKGEAFLTDLPEGLLTDVVVLDGSFFEPDWIMAQPGISILPRKGHLSRAEFPIHHSGEIDGTLYARTETGDMRVLKSLKLRLVDKAGRVVQRTMAANDGFYLFSKVPPGEYFIVADPEDLKLFHVTPDVPQPIAFGYDGGVIYGHNIIFAAGDDLEFDVVSSESVKKSYPDVRVPVGDQIALNIGDFASDTAMTAMWLTMRKRYGSIIGDLYTIFDEGAFSPDHVTGRYAIRLGVPSRDIEEAFTRCRALVARGVACRIEYLPNPGNVHVALNTEGGH